jgi:DNA invertase Pin-like site-specific DNA recombinase
MTAYGYSRVSTKDQLEGFGLHVQRELLHDHGVARLLVFSDEGVSGALLDRPALGNVINVLGTGDVLYVPRLDRLARDLITQELLLRAIRAKGADVVSCVEGENAYLAEDAGDPSRKLIRQILGAVAEYERSMIALRTQAGKRAKKAAGGYAGGQPPYGWTGRDGVLVEVESEQWTLEAISTILPMFRGPNGTDYQGISNWLQERTRYAYTRRNGKPWTRQSVRKVLLRQGTPAGAVRQDGRAVLGMQVDDQVAVFDGDSGQDVGADGSSPLGL